VPTVAPLAHRTQPTPSHAVAAAATIGNSASGVPAGLAYGLAAYLSWGFVPLYFWLLKDVPPEVVLAHRVVWSVGFLGLLLAQQGQLRAVARCLADRRALLVLLGSTLMIAANWYTFIWAVSHNHVTEASFGYFVNPLVNVLLGVVVLKERLRPAQLAAIALACVGVAVRTGRLGGLPVVSLVLAGSFGLYGLLRKVVAAGPLVGLSVETLLLFPVCLGYLLVAGPAIGGGGPAAALTAWGPGVGVLLVASGVVTAIPLLWFAAAARRLRLTTIGFLQYLAPTCQLLLAVLAFGEPFAAGDLAAFGCIWLAIGVFSADAVRAVRGRPARRRAGSTSGGLSQTAEVRR
jgi:chloramphenicol-sensitive protein RarD